MDAYADRLDPADEDQFTSPQSGDALTEPEEVDYFDAEVERDLLHLAGMMRHTHDLEVQP